MERLKDRRHYLLQFYLDNSQHMNILNHIINSNYKYIYVIHDEDLDDNNNLKKPHIHLILSFDYVKSYRKLISDLELDEKFIQSVENIKTTSRYLLHLDNSNKHQYPYSSLVTNDMEFYRKYFINSESEEENIHLILEFIVHYKGIVRYNDLCRFVLENKLWSYFRRSANIINRFLDEHNREYY